MSRTLLSNLADLNNAVVWMVSILPPIFNCSNPHSSPLGTVAGAPTTTGITVFLIFHFFFLVLWQGLIIYLFTFFYFHSVVRWNGKIHKMTGSVFFFFLFISSRFSLLGGIRWTCEFDSACEIWEYFMKLAVTWKKGLCKKSFYFVFIDGFNEILIHSLTHTHTHTHTHIYIYISSPSCHFASTDFSDSSFSFISIVHLIQQVH